MPASRTIFRAHEKPFEYLLAVLALAGLAGVSWLAQGFLAALGMGDRPLVAFMLALPFHFFVFHQAPGGSWHPLTAALRPLMGIMLVAWYPVLAMLELYGAPQTVARLQGAGMWLHVPPLLILAGFLVRAADSALGGALAGLSWHGARMRPAGGATARGWAWLWTGLVALLTLGLALPWREVKLARLWLSHLRIGGARVEFSDSGWARALYPPFALLWFTMVLWLLLVGGAAVTRIPSYFVAVMLALAGALVLWLVWHALRLNWLAAHTRVDGRPLRLNLSWKDLLRAGLPGAIISLLSLGVLSPLARRWLAKGILARLDSGRL